MFYYSDPDVFAPVTNPARALADAGHEVDIVAYYRGKEWEGDYGPGVRLIRLNRPGMHFPATAARKIQGLWEFVRRSVRIARSERYDLVYGHDVHGFLAAHRASRTLQVPVVYHCHDLTELGRLGRLDRLVKLYEMRYGREAAATILPEARRARAMAKQNRLAREPVVVWNCPPRGPRPRTDLLREFLGRNVDERTKFVVRHGSSGPSHCLEETIHSMPHWPPDVHFVLIGCTLDGPPPSNGNGGTEGTGRADGASADGLAGVSRFVRYAGFSNPEYIRRLERLAERLGCRHRLHLLPPVRHEDVFDWIAAAHVGHALYQPTDDVNRRYQSTASLKLFEYMRAGLPVLAAEEEGFARIVEQFDCGVCVRWDDPQALAAAIWRLVSNEPLRSRLGENAYRAHVEKCNYAVQYRPVLALLERLS